MPEEPTPSWKNYEYDSFMIREKELNKPMRGAGSALNQSLETYDFPDSVIDASAIKPGSLLGDFRISSGSLSSRDYGRFGTGWSLNSDGTINGISAGAGGSNTQVQFNDNGVLGGHADLTWNKSTSYLTVKNISGTLTANLNIITPDSTTASTKSILLAAGGVSITATSGTITSGDILLYGGDFRGDNNGTGTTSAGDVFIYGGQARKVSGGTKGTYGGLIELGAGNSNWGDGGRFNIWSGRSTGGNGNGGDINITIGLGNGTGRNGYLMIYNLPTSNPEVAGVIYNDGGTIKISSG